MSNPVSGESLLEEVKNRHDFAVVISKDIKET